MKLLVPPLLLAWSICTCTAQGQSLFSVIQNEPELSNFTKALQLTGLDLLLSGQSTQLTVLAPSNAALDNVPAFHTYMMGIEWKRHLSELLRHMMIEPAQTLDEWTELVVTNGGTLHVEMLSGFNTTATTDGGELMIDGATLTPLDVKVANGNIQLVEHAPLPPSVQYTIFNLTQQNPEMTTVTRLTEFALPVMDSYIDNLSPATFFSPINYAWDAIIPSLEIEDVLKNHLFEQLLFDDILGDMDGEQITSVNGKNWSVQVLDDPSGEPLHYDREGTPIKIVISNTEGPEGLTNCTITPGRNQTNILASNGIIHSMDCLFLDYNYERVDRNAPTFAPVTIQVPPPSAAATQQPISPTPAPARTTSPSSGADLSGFGIIVVLLPRLSSNAISF